MAEKSQNIQQANAPKKEGASKVTSDMKKPEVPRKKGKEAEKTAKEEGKKLLSRKNLRKKEAD